MPTISGMADRIWCTTSTEGAGTYTSLGAKNSSYFDLDEAGSSHVVGYCCTDNINVEIGYGTVTVGASKTLTRDTIIRSTNGNAPVAWTTGVRDLFVFPLAQDVMLVNRVPVMQASLDMDGHTIVLSPDGATSMAAPGNTALGLNVTSAASFAWTNVGVFQATWMDSGATVGPSVVLLRSSASPAANDTLGAMIFYGQNSSAANLFYGYIQAAIQNPAAGAETGAVSIQVMRASVLTKVLEVNGNQGVVLDSASYILTGGKTSPNLDTNGVEIRAIGQIGLRAVGANTPLVVGQDTQGALVDFRVGGVSVANIVVASGVVTYGTFSGHHWSWWAKGAEPAEEPPLGSLLSAVDEDYLDTAGAREHVPCVRLSQGRREKAVYGLFAGYSEVRTEMDVAALDELLARHPEIAQRLVSREQMPAPPLDPQMTDLLVKMVAVRPPGPTPDGELATGWWPSEGAPRGITAGARLAFESRQVTLLNGGIYPMPVLVPWTGAEGQTIAGAYAGYVHREMRVSKEKADGLIANLPGFWERIISREDGPPPVPPAPRVAVVFRRIIVGALGSASPGVLVKGPCEVGDVLQSSDLPGIAEVAPEGTDFRYIIGKVWGAKQIDDPELVRGSVHAG